LIRVLIVDDDKLVRKGLISSMPWRDFGMEVVGEANNGENALKIMEDHPVDLLMTDLAMPIMSGIELMRIVRRQYPSVEIVVLSMHQDFEYVQEALRLGAIDYIAKFQLEREQFESVLGRIVQLLERKEGWKAGKEAGHPKEEAPADEVYVLYSLSQGEDEAHPPETVPASAAEADAGVWYWNASGADGSEPQAPPPHSALVRIVGLGGMDRGALLQLIRTYRKNELFYDYDPYGPIRTLYAAEAAARTKANAGVDTRGFAARWEAADWINEDDAYREMIRELKQLRLPPVRLARMFYSLTDEWNRLYQPLLREPIVIEDFFPSWHRFEEWLNEVRGRIREAGAKPQFSPEIRSSIVKAVNLVQQSLGEPITAADIAQRVNMSISYFSQCFKQYTGQSFTDYVRDLRMERAKKYLKSTTRTIQWIAEQIGYQDEKYFSRLFREHAGVLPSEYRQQNASGESGG
jgi:two-component system response regulator YesN